VRALGFRAEPVANTQTSGTLTSRSSITSRRSASIHRMHTAVMRAPSSKTLKLHDPVRSSISYIPEKHLRSRTPSKPHKRLSVSGLPFFQHTFLGLRYILLFFYYRNMRAMRIHVQQRVVQSLYAARGPRAWYGECRYCESKFV
jgi:hypothetical protein